MNTEPGKRKTFLLKSVDCMCHKILELYLRFWDHECCRQSMYLSFPKQWKLKKKLIKIQFSRVASLYIRYCRFFLLNRDRCFRVFISFFCSSCIRQDWSNWHK